MSMTRNYKMMTVIKNCLKNISKLENLPINNQNLVVKLRSELAIQTFHIKFWLQLRHISFQSLFHSICFDLLLNFFTEFLLHLSVTQKALFSLPLSRQSFRNRLAKFALMFFCSLPSIYMPRIRLISLHTMKMIFQMLCSLLNFKLYNH